jgi:hypothetical protein
MQRHLARVTSLLAFALVASLLTPSISAAQSSSGLVLRIESPNRESTRVSGNMTVTGVAVNCDTGEAATRVAVYDGRDGGDRVVYNTTTRQGSGDGYVADVSMDTAKNITRYCAGRVGNPRIGFTLIFDTGTLSDGARSLQFVAEFPNGATTTASLPVVVDNTRFRYDPGYGYGYGPYYDSGYRYAGSYVYPYNSYPVNNWGAWGNNWWNGYNYNWANQYNWSNWGWGTSNPYVWGGWNGSGWPNYNWGWNSPWVSGYPYFNLGTITLDQAGQTLSRNTNVALSGSVACGGQTFVQIYDGGSLVGQTSTFSTFSINWATPNVSGTRSIQITIQGACGVRTQTFSVTLA